MHKQNRIYFDNAATTRADDRVVTAMMPFLNGDFGNPSSMHSDGRSVRYAVKESRAQVAALINAAPEEVVFTSSGTEADNLALLGIASAAQAGKHSVVLSAFEHPAVSETCDYLKTLGCVVSVVRPDGEGIVSAAALDEAIPDGTALVSVMTANNVVGTIQPISELATVAHSHGALFHTDAVQAAGKIPIDVNSMGIDLLSISAHKIHGVKGVGALYVRKGLTINPVLHGGGQERGLRSSTENVPGIVGFGEAARICKEEMAGEAARLVSLRDKLIDGTLEAVPNAYVIGSRYLRLPGHVCLGFAGVEGEAIKLLMDLDERGFSVSAGSACSSNNAHQSSHVLVAMGYDQLKARGSLRVTLGRFNTKSEVDAFLKAIPEAVSCMRKLTSNA